MEPLYIVVIIHNIYYMRWIKFDLDQVRKNFFKKKWNYVASPV